VTAVTVLGSVSGAPGVTTAVLALAMAWPPERSLLLVELAASGGDLATWLDLPPAPSSVTAATEGRRELSAATLWGHTLPLPGLGRVRVLAAPPGAEQAVAARRRLLDAGLDRALAGLTDTDVLVDVGRIAAGTAASDLPAGPLLVVARPQVSDVRHLLHRPAAAEPARLLLVGDVPYGPGEVADATRMPVGAVLPHDEGAAGALTGEGPLIRDLDRTPLLRAARPLAEALTGVTERLARARRARRRAPEVPVRGAHRRWVGADTRYEGAR